jgi:hypothetical protein
MYRTGRTDIISEGIVIETMKTVVSDAVKNLLSTGAVIVAGGLPADTIVDALYAIEQTKTAINVYNSFLDAKDQANKIVVDFMKAVDSVNLENNVDEIKNIAIQAAVNLGKEGDKLVGDGFAGDVVHDGMIVMEELREKFLTFFKEILGSVANWISTLIPDDGGNVSTFIKVTVFTVVEQGTKKPLSVVDELLQKLPSQVSEIILDEVKLESFLVDICNQVADGIEENKDQIGTALSVGVTGAKIMTGTGRTLFPGMDMMAKGIGKAGQAVTDFVAGEDSTSGKVVRGLLDNQYAFDSIEENIEFIKEELPDYIRTEIIPEIGETVETYAKFMKYIIAFLGVVESTMTGELELAMRSGEVPQSSPIQQPMIDVTPQEDEVAALAEQIIRRSRRRRHR